MGKIIVSEFVTLDSVMETPENWVPDNWNNKIAQFKLDELFEVDGLLLGEVTYEIFAGSWPEREGEMADKINGLPKYVATKRKELEWNNSTPLSGDIANAVAALKQSGKTLMLNGSGELLNTIIKHELVDEYKLLVFPVVLGKGKRLFKEGTKANLELIEATPFETGVVLMRYASKK